MSEALPRALIEEALEQAQRWSGLARSPQLAKFLNYIVAAKLNGDEANIKAYTIAVDVFGRAPEFDPQMDPIVRVQARRLRALLDEYYQTAGAESPVRITLPIGRYVPEFMALQDKPAVAALAGANTVVAPKAKMRSAIRWRELWVLVGLTFAAIVVTLLIGGALQPALRGKAAPSAPSIEVGEFTSIAGDEGASKVVAGLAVELVTDLQLFNDIDASYYAGGLPQAGATPAKFRLTGFARRIEGRLVVTASLMRVGSDGVTWTQSVTMDDSKVDDLSQALAEHLGSHRGPLFADAMTWLDQNEAIEGNESEFICGMLFSRYRDSSGSPDEERARSCVNAVLSKSPNSAASLAMSAAMLVDSTVATSPPGQLDPEPLQESERLLNQARQLAPTSSFVWEQYGRFLAVVARYGEAEEAFASAIQLNPANLDCEAALAQILTLRGPSARGDALALSTLQRSEGPPRWYYIAPALNALRHGNNADAMFNADLALSADPELASVIETVAAQRMGNETILNRTIVQVLGTGRFMRYGILPVLRGRIADSKLVDDMAAALRAAGVTEAALNGKP